MKLTRGKKNQLARDKFQARVEEIAKYGFSITKHCIGDTRCEDNWQYYLVKDEDVCHGGCYKGEYSCVALAEKMIIDEQLTPPLHNKQTR